MGGDRRTRCAYLVALSKLSQDESCLQQGSNNSTDGRAGQCLCRYLAGVNKQFPGEACHPHMARGSSLCTGPLHHLLRVEKV